MVKTRVVNIQEPVDLFEVNRAGGAAAEFSIPFVAARRSGALLPAHPGDGPLMLVLSCASQLLMQGGAGFDPVWEPPGK